MTPALRIPAADLHKYLNRYDYDEDSPFAHIRIGAAAQGYLSRSQLHELAKWKSKRRAKLVLANDEDFVNEITAFVFRAKHEYSRIGALTLLAGVQYPTASVVLHFVLTRRTPSSTTGRYGVSVLLSPLSTRLNTGWSTLRFAALYPSNMD